MRIKDPINDWWMEGNGINEENVFYRGNLLASKGMDSFIP